MIDIQTFLVKHRLKPSKALGQHYLVDEEVLRRIVEVADIQPGEPVLEIGAGPGILTRALATAGAEVLAVEFDRQFCRLLQDEFHNWRNVKVLCDDALRLDLAELGRQKMVANIPYQITNPLVRKILEPSSPIATAVLMIQAEVADRLMALPGSSDRGILTIMVELYGQIEKMLDVPPTAFWPVPVVKSAVIKITQGTSTGTSTKSFTDPKQEAAFFWLVKQGFSGKRKLLVNSLAGSLRLPKSTVTAIVESAGIDSQLRAEDVSLAQWLSLFKHYQHHLTESV